MIFYYENGTCSIGIHVLMEETGEKYVRQRVPFAENAQRSAAHLAVNPKGKVPVLDDHGTVVTEFQAIAFYLARRFPERKLLPPQWLSEIRVMELLDYIVATVHMRGFSRLSNQANFSKDGDPELVRKDGRRFIDEGLAYLESKVGEGGYFLGEFSIADAALFVIEFWSWRREIALPPALDAHFRLMLSRASVRNVLKVEGYEAPEPSAVLQA